MANGIGTPGGWKTVDEMHKKYSLDLWLIAGTNGAGLRGGGGVPWQEAPECGPGCGTLQCAGVSDGGGHGGPEKRGRGRAF